MTLPEFRLLDARESGLTEAGLRTLAAERTTASAAPFVSRSYRFPYALVAWHDSPIGIDLERIEPCDRDFGRSICTVDEVDEFDGRIGDAAFVPSLWSSKEALAKALGDATRYDPRKLESPMRWPDGRSGAWQAAQLDVAAGHVAWLCWRDTA